MRSSTKYSILTGVIVVLLIWEVLNIRRDITFLVLSLVTLVIICFMIRVIFVTRRREAAESAQAWAETVFLAKAARVYFWGYPLGELSRADFFSRLADDYSDYSLSYSMIELLNLSAVRDVSGARIMGCREGYGCHYWVEFSEAGAWWAVTQCEYGIGGFAVLPMREYRQHILCGDCGEMHTYDELSTRPEYQEIFASSLHSHDYDSTSSDLQIFRDFDLTQDIIDSYL